MCSHHDLVIATVHQVHLTNLEQRQKWFVDHRTKPAV